MKRSGNETRGLGILDGEGTLRRDLFSVSQDGKYTPPKTVLLHPVIRALLVTPLGARFPIASRNSIHELGTEGESIYSLFAFSFFPLPGKKTAMLPGMTIIARTIFNPGTDRQTEIVWKEADGRYYVQVYRGERLEHDYILRSRESALQVYLQQCQAYAPN